MKRIKNLRLATQGIGAALLLGIGFAAGAEQMMRALPGTSPATTAKAVVVAPAGMPKLPDLAFSNMTVDNTTYLLDINSGAKSLVVNNIVPSVKTGANPCDRSFTFPLQLNVKNIGQAEFVPKSSFEAVGVSIGQWGGAKDLIKLPVSGGQTMNFSVSLPPGKYTLNADIVSKNVAESRTDNNKLNWPLEVKCTVKANAVMQAPTQSPTQRSPGQSMGGGLRMGSALTPASQPPVQPPKGFGSEKHSTLAHAEPPQGRGAALLNPDAACMSDNTPRISAINGTTHGFDIQPGQKLNIVGCGFGRNGQAYLSGGGTTIDLKIDSWKDSTVVAHVDAALGGVRDFDAAKVNVKPSGAAVLGSIETSKFRAVRVDSVVALPPELGTYSTIYGAPIRGLSSSSTFTRVERNLNTNGQCPTVETIGGQEKKLKDSWPVNFLADGFEVLGVTYDNRTDQTTGDDDHNTWFPVGNSGKATWDASTRLVVVTFQGHSNYQKPVGLIVDSGSTCTSLYFVSLNVRGPRGISPMK